MHIAHFLISALVEHARFDQMVENEPNFLLKVGTLIFAARGYFVLEEIFPLFENNLRYFDSTLKVPPEPHSSVLL
jgi:RsiW-degrading membrane proteinase PrsW (M82 family)